MTLGQRGVKGTYRMLLNGKSSVKSWLLTGLLPGKDAENRVEVPLVWKFQQHDNLFFALLGIRRGLNRRMEIAMRKVGRVTDWNDEKGFGFVVPHDGGTRAFVHVRQFQRKSRRPVAGDLISYVPVVDERGRTNAKQIRHAGERIELPGTPSRTPRAALGVCALALVAGLWVMGVVPPLLLGVYLGMSALSYFMYWSDKSAAQKGRSRTPENRLHIVDFLGGWPGALIAQQQFHHKTVKQPFGFVFRLTVLLNLAAGVWLVKSGLADKLAQVLLR